MRQRILRGLKLGIPPLIAGILIWLMLRRVDFVKLEDAFLHVNLWWVAAGLAAELISILFRAARYQRLMGFANCPGRYSTFLSGTVIGYLITNIFPFRLGEVARPWLIARESGKPFPRLLAGVGLERIMDVLSLGAAFGLFLLLAPDLLSARTENLGDLPMDRLFQRLAEWSEHTLLLGLGFTLAVAALLLLPKLLLRWRGKIEAVERRGGRIGRLAESLMHMLESLAVLNRPMAALEMAGWTVLITLFITIGAMLLVLACGIPLGLAPGLLLMVAVSLGYGIPVPGGIGGVQFAAYLCLYTVLGHDEVKSQAAGWVLWAAFVLPTILWGGLLVWLKGLKLMEIVSAAKATKAELKAGDDGAGVNAADANQINK